MGPSVGRFTGFQATRLTAPAEGETLIIERVHIPL
jgi:hypothetical protein